MNMDSAHKGIVAVVSIVGCALFAYLLFSLFGPEDKADAVEPVTSNDRIIPDYIEAVHQQSAACDEVLANTHQLEAVADECLQTLRTCREMLEAHYLIPKKEAP